MSTTEKDYDNTGDVMAHRHFGGDPELEDLLDEEERIARDSYTYVPLEVREAEAIKQANDEGYTVAGWAEDLYVGAEFCIFGVMDYDKPIKGTVLHIAQPSGMSHEDFEDEMDALDRYAIDYDDMYEPQPRGPVGYYERVAKAIPRVQHFVVNFSYIDLDGVQKHGHYGRNYEVRFKFSPEQIAEAKIKTGAKQALMDEADDALAEINNKPWWKFWG